MRKYEFNESYNRMYGGRAMTVTFIVTHQCNLRCTYCYEHNKSDAVMTFETAKQCVDMMFREDERESGYIDEVRANGVVLDFIGGEPLLEIELIDKTVDYFRAEAMKRNHRWALRHMISISTNGLMYFDERVQRFLKKNQGRVSMSVTVDGDKETHDSCRLDCNGCGSYDRSHAAMEHLAKEYGLVGSKFTIAPGNVHRVYSIPP